MRKRGMTKIELLVAVSLVAFMLVGGCSYLYASVRNAKVTLGCQTILKQMGLVARMYAHESPDEFFPPLLLRGFERTDGSIQTVFALGMDPTTIYPEYTAYHRIFVCYFDWYTGMDEDYFLAADGTVLLTEWRGPEDGGPLTANGNPCTDSRSCINAVDNSYWYLGFVYDRIDTDAPAMSMDALLPAMEMIGGDSSIVGGIPAQLAHGFEEILVQRALAGIEAHDLDSLNGAVRSDIPVPAGHGNNGGNIVYRLREGVARFLITDVHNPDALATAEAAIPMAWDRVAMSADGFAHPRRLGGNVLYLDGHADFVAYPGPAPMHEGIARFGAAMGR